jgi:hypothetical protein
MRSLRMTDIAEQEFHDDHNSDSAIHDEIYDKSNSHRSSYILAYSDTFHIPTEACIHGGSGTK